MQCRKNRLYRIGQVYRSVWKTTNIFVKIKPKDRKRRHKRPCEHDTSMTYDIIFLTLQRCHALWKNSLCQFANLMCRKLWSFFTQLHLTATTL